MRIEITEADCTRHKDRYPLKVFTIMLAVGLAFVICLGVAIGTKTQTDMATIALDIIVLLLAWLALCVAVVVGLHVSVSTEPLSCADGFADAVKKKIKQAYGLQYVDITYPDLKRACEVPIPIYVSFDDASEIREQVLLDISYAGSRHEATLDVHLYRAKPEDAAQRYEEIKTTQESKQEDKTC